MKQTDIVFEDKNMMVLEKSSGVVTTKEGGDKNTVEDWLVENFKWAVKMNRAGIVHRLDKGTSGLLLVAKTENSFFYLKQQFKKRLVYKEYWALVEGDVSFEGEMMLPIGRSKYNFLRWAVSELGKRAWTTFELMEKFEMGGKKYSLVKIVLKTGRTHQIRVHFSHLGWPLVGDKLYGGKLDLISRPFLHAKKIALVGIDGVNFEFETDLSDDLKLVLEGR